MFKKSSKFVFIFLLIIGWVFSGWQNSIFNFPFKIEKAYALTYDQYNTAGTVQWTAPAGVTSVTAECWGSGGGGAGSTSATLGGTGGGAGAYAKTNTVTVVPGSKYNVVIGAAGTAGASGAAGGTGGDTSFTGASGSCIAKGGTGGAINGGTAGTGGQSSASTGDVKYNGGGGFKNTTTAGGGGGGSGGTGSVGNAATSVTGATAVTGGGNGGNGGAAMASGSAPTTAPGGGGGGGGCAYKSGVCSAASGNTKTSGGAGKAGQVKINYPVLVILGDGTNQAGSTIGPGATATEIDRFSMKMNVAGSDTATGFTVTLAGNASAYTNIATVGIYNTSETLQCSGTPSSNAVAITGCSIALNSSLTEYIIKITPDSHAAMPAVPGASYSTTATVTAITSQQGYSSYGTDTASATVIVDNLSPAGTTNANPIAGDAHVDLSWTNPADSDFQQVYVYCKTSSMIAGEAPTEGTDPAVDGTACDGTARMKYKGTVSPQAISSLVNGTPYYFRIYARDTNGNFTAYANTQQVSATPVALVLTTTLSDGANPGGSTIAPGAAITSVNGFTLTTSSGTDAITAITISLSSNSGVGTLSITNSSDTVLGSIGGGTGSGIISGSNSISITSTNATTSGTAFKVKITPLSHAAMPFPPGANYTITGAVTDWTGTNTKAGQANDLSSAVTIDNLSPAGTTGASATASASQVQISWINPVDSDFQQVYIYCKSSSMVSGDAPTEGTDPATDTSTCNSTMRMFYKGTSSPQNLPSWNNSTTYYFRIYARDTNGNFTAYANTQQVSATTPSLPTVTTTSPITSIAQTTATGGGNVTSNGGSTVTVSGVIWDTSSSPTIALSTKTTDGSASGTWASNITGLTPGVLYYVRSYATNAVGTSYGSDVTFTTLATPTVTSPTSASVTGTTATLGANVTSLGIPASISARGVCYATTSNPTTPCVAEGSTTTGVFTKGVTGLTAGTLYYYRGYATNTTGTGYSSDGTFTTSATTPTLTTITPATSITTTTAVGSGNISSNGGATVTVSGLVWDTSINPTTALSTKTTDGWAIGGPWTSINPMTGLTAGTLYHYRAYATNSAGTSYGSDVTFTTTAVYSLTVNPSGGTGTGTITSSPAGIDCGLTCIYNYTSGTSVTLTATPAGGNTFAGWSGSGCSGTGTCVITVDSNKSTTATFNLTGGTLPITGTFTSSVFDSAITGGAAFNSIMWKGTAGTGKVRFQFAAATANTGPWTYYGDGGAGCGTGVSDYFDSTGPNNPVELKGSTCVSNWKNKRYYRYKLKICSNDCLVTGSTSPTVTNVIVNWSP